MASKPQLYIPPAPPGEWVDWDSVPWQANLAVQLAKSGGRGEVGEALASAAMQLQRAAGGGFASSDGVTEPLKRALAAEAAADERAARRTGWTVEDAGPTSGGEPFQKSHLADNPWYRAYAGTPFWGEALDAEEAWLKARRASGEGWPDRKESSAYSAAQDGLALKRIRWMRSRAHDGRTEKSMSPYGSWSDFEDEPAPAGVIVAATALAKADSGTADSSAADHEAVPKEYREAGATERAHYADGENYKYPIYATDSGQRKKYVRAAVGYFSKPENANAYPPDKRAAIWGRIKAAAKREGIETSEESGPPSLEGKKSMTSKMALPDLRKALGDLAKGESYEGMPKPGAEDLGKEVVIRPAEDVPTMGQLADGDPMDKLLAQGSPGSGDGGLGKADGDDSDMHREPGEFYERASLDYGPVQVGRGAGGLMWTQGPGAAVLYTSIADHRISKAIEDGSIDGGQHEFGRFSHQEITACGGCGAGFAKALTVCPDCGMDQRDGGQRQFMGGASIDDAVTKSLIPPAPWDTIDYGP